MNWVLPLVIIFGGLAITMGSGSTVVAAFMIVNLVGVYFLWGGQVGLEQIIYSLASSVSSFALVALPLFVLMGDVMFNAGIAPQILDGVDKWLGRLPGRLSLVAVGAGTLFGALTGAGFASTAMLGSSLVPDMEKRGYKKPMTLGPILGSGCLAIMIPPSGLAVLMGAIGEISIGKILVGIIIPGILMAALYAAYIIIRCWLQPDIAPTYDVARISFLGKLLYSAKYILPASIVVFLVVGVMLLGVATPSEAAATGCLGMFLLAALYKRLTWAVVKKSLISTTQITAMVLIILTGADAFGQILAYSGATKGLAAWTVGLPIGGWWVIFAMQVVLILLGTAMPEAAMMMVTLPIFVPVVEALGFDTVWFGVVYLLNITMATISPPFGLSLYVMKGVAPRGTTMGDVFRASLPFLYIDFVALVLIMVFPQLALWLPSVAG